MSPFLTLQALAAVTHFQRAIRICAHVGFAARAVAAPQRPSANHPPEPDAPPPACSRNARKPAGLARFEGSPGRCHAAGSLRLFPCTAATAAWPAGSAIATAPPHPFAAIAVSLSPHAPALPPVATPACSSLPALPPPAGSGSLGNIFIEVSRGYFHRGTIHFDSTKTVNFAGAQASSRHEPSGAAISVPC